MVLARKLIRLAGAEGFAEGLVQALASAGPEYLATGLANARLKAISNGDFDRADALRLMQRRLGLPAIDNDDGGSTAAKIRELEERIRRLENGRPEPS